MSDSKLFNEALDALYKAAKASANFVEVTLTSENIDFSPGNKERLKTALSVLKITWLHEDDDEYDEYDEDDEYDEYDEDDEYDDDDLLYTPNNN